MFSPIGIPISRVVKRFSFLVLPGVMLSVAGCAKVLGATDFPPKGEARTTFHEIRVGSARRNFLLHRPPPPYGRPLPLLVLLHGSSANANVMMEESGMNAIADSLGALVVYPNGTGEIPYFRLFWNETGCCARPAGVRGVDEEAMLLAIVDSISRAFPIDRTRMGLAGFSDPGSMAYLIACDQSEVWTTIGVIAGKLPATTCGPKRGVSTVVFHGTADHNIRYGSTAADVDAWAQRQRCNAGVMDSTGLVKTTDYAGCRDGAEVKLYSLIGGRHGWPGGRKSWLLAPSPSRAVDASRVFANFVISHPRTAGR
ncbi:MAG: hypothetical protein M3Z17_06360 [Gemmatimonadota bacterium]|nr:hypothetical protein [Gemmatimonadota bacterium]